MFTFPIPTYNITPDFDWDHPNCEALFEMTAKYGMPYFQNFVNSELKPHMIRSMCCRLQLDLTELLKRGNGLFGSAEQQTGSLGVVTINCARIGYLHAGDEAALMARLDQLAGWARDSLEVKRKLIQRLIDQGLFPYTKRYLGTLRNHFSTSGVNGVNEMIRNFTRDTDDITPPAGHALALRLLNRLRRHASASSRRRPATCTTSRRRRPRGRRTASRRKTASAGPDILQAGTPATPYYTNSSQLPVGHTDDPFEALAMQETLQKKYTGGTVLHLYMNERVSSPEACKALVRRSLERFGLPYITVTPTFSICPAHGYLAGEHEFCPHCDEERLERNGAGSRPDCNARTTNAPDPIRRPGQERTP